MVIYKIFTQSQWDALAASGETLGAPIDLADGYIHFSTAEQAGETAAKHFAAQTDLVLAAVPALPLGQDLTWEVSRGDALFPHLYRSLRMTDVAWCKPLPLVNGVHQFPDLDAENASR